MKTILNELLKDFLGFLEKLQPIILFGSILVIAFKVFENTWLEYFGFIIFAVVLSGTFIHLLVDFAEKTEITLNKTINKRATKATYILAVVLGISFFVAVIFAVYEIFFVASQVIKK